MGLPEERRTARKLLEAEGYLELGMANEAVEVLESTAPSRALAFEFHLLHGLALRDLKRYSDALVPLLKAAKYRAADSMLCLAMGWCLKRTGRLAEAIEALERAQAAHPDEALLQYNLACYHSLAGKRDMAVSWLRSALGLSPEMRELIPDESDFDPLKGDPEFEEIARGTFLA